MRRSTEERNIIKRRRKLALALIWSSDCIERNGFDTIKFRNNNRLARILGDDDRDDIRDRLRAEHGRIDMAEYHRQAEDDAEWDNMVDLRFFLKEEERQSADWDEYDEIERRERDEYFRQCDADEWYDYAPISEEEERQREIDEAWSMYQEWGSVEAHYDRLIDDGDYWHYDRGAA